MLRVVAVWMTVILMMQCVQCIDEKLTSDQIGSIKKRSHNPWFVPRFNSLSVYDAGKVFRPATRTIAPPYFIPVYGAAGHYIFYPPQPLYTNPGIPVDNPDKIPFKGQSYLPPTPNKEVSTNNRFGADDDDAPIWGSIPNNKETDQSVKTTTTNSGNQLDRGDPEAPIWGFTVPGTVHLSETDQFDSQPQQSSVRPTRPPSAAILPPRPPLVHDGNQPQSEISAPLPPQAVAEEAPGMLQQSSPSNCVWAIISCCSATSTTPSQNCFEQRGCPGPFWGNSPCHSDFARTAIALAVEYYNKNPSG